ncbi:MULTISPECIES: hypothetical protein [Streptomyces]|uniref:Uncharacterized protein n=3 Tax=Streptomyces TaxID=1883 RepID=A0A3S9PBR8_STRLT|nr:hypothetical protein [Streptomyces luteoverticillatus]AZQ69827.1 hypothetical protein EKH77_00035 [Streptomyces luteoverticillatus]
MSQTATSEDSSLLQDRARQRCARIALALLIPTVLACGFLYLASDYGGRCITYGEHCSQVPDEWTYAAFATSAVCGSLAAGVPSHRRWIRTARAGLLAVQILAHVAVAALVIS